MDGEPVASVAPGPIDPVVQDGEGTMGGRVGAESGMEVDAET